MSVLVCDLPGQKLTVVLRRKGNKRGWWAFFHLTLWYRRINLAGHISQSRDLFWQTFRIIIQCDSFCSHPLHSDARISHCLYASVQVSSCPSVPFSGTQYLRNTLKECHKCLIGHEIWTYSILGSKVKGQRELRKQGLSHDDKCPIG